MLRMRFSRCSEGLPHPDASMNDLSTLRRSFRTHRLRRCPTRGSTPGWYAVPRWGTPKACQPGPAEPRPKPERSGVGLERALEANIPTPSRKARKLLLPRAYSASGGLMPRSSFKNTVVVWSGTFCVDMRDRPPADSETTKTRAERCQAGASLGGEHPAPSRKARKLILLRAYSASVGLMPRSLLSEWRPDAA